MKITNLASPLVDMRGEAVKVEDEKILIRDVLANIVAAGFERPEQSDVAQLFDLANAIFKSEDELELSSKQIEFINKSVGSRRWEGKYSAYIVGQVLRVTGLEVADKKEKK